MQTRRVFTGAPWEAKVGYCRAIERSGWVLVSGTVAVDSQGRVLTPGNAYRQALACFGTIERALTELGVPIDAVVRTRMYVTNMDDWMEIGRAHAEFFAAHPPVTTMVQVSRLIDPDLVVEIEAEALVENAAG